MSTRLVTASRRAVLAAAVARSTCVLDVLAPAAAAVCGPPRSYSTRQAPPNSAPPSTPAASSSKVRLDSASSRSQDDTRPSKSAHNTSGKPRQTPARPNKHAATSPSSSSSRGSGTARRAPAPSPSASDLLSEIRKSPPPSQASPSSSSKPRPHAPKPAWRDPLDNVHHGLLGKRRDFARAFLQGWVPLRRAGQAGRIPPADLGRLVQAVAKAAKDHPASTPTEAHWPAVRELVLYAAGEKDPRPVADWAWRALELGPAGAGRVVEVWEAVRRGEHRALREGPNAASARCTPPAAEFAPTTTAAAAAAAAPPPDPRPSVHLFAASLAAQALLRALAPPSSRPPLASLVPYWAAPSSPLLQPLLSRSAGAGSAQTLVERHVPAGAYPSLAAPGQTALSALRHAALAQVYYARRDRDAPGVGLLARARELFRSGRADEAWALWGDGEARGGEGDQEAKVEEERAPAAAGEEEEGTPLPPATLHQAIVSTFLAGFVQAQATAHANTIWSWLLSRSPPLVPGLVCWTGLLHGYAARGEVQAVEAAFAELQRVGPPAAPPDVWAWLERVDAHFAARLPDEAMRLARDMMRDKGVLRSLGGGSSGGDNAPPLPEEAWNRLMVGLLSNGRRIEAEALLDEMRRAGVEPSIFTVNGFLKSYTRGARPDLAAVVRVLRLITEHGLEPDVYTFTMVLQTLLAGGLKDATARTIAIMEQAKVKPTATTYGAIVHDLVQSGQREHLDAAVQLLDEMEAKRIPANEVIYTSLIQGFLGAIPSTPVSSADPSPSSALVSVTAGAAGLDAASRAQHPYMVAALTLKQRMEKRGLRLNRIGHNAFLAAALALQSEWGTDFALRLFATMQRERGALSRAAGAAGNAGSGSGEGNEDAAAEAQAGRGSTPSDTWYVLLDGFVRMGDFGRAEAVVHEMRRQGFEVRNRGLQRLVNQVVRGRP